MGEYVRDLAPDKIRRDKNDVPYYMFTDIMIKGKKSAADKKVINRLMESYEWRPHFLQHEHDLQHIVKPASHQLFVGGVGTGAPIHWHSDAWNVCAHGSRRWYLFPPSIAVYSNMPMKQWIKEEYPKLPPERRPLECMQNGGDIIFVPHLYGHGTYTVKAAVGVAVEMANALFSTRYGD
jgi:hypothetical protein